MTDSPPLAPPTQFIETDAHGDPIRQGTLMNERQSYERVIEGLKIASDAAAHLVKSEPANNVQWRALSIKLDQARRICVQHAKLGDVQREKQTQEVRGDPMNWRWGRDRFRYGLGQASGGCLQLATCHRGDFWWSQMSRQLEGILDKLKPKSMQQIHQQAARRKLILPGTRH